MKHMLQKSVEKIATLVLLIFPNLQCLFQTGMRVHHLFQTTAGLLWPTALIFAGAKTYAQYQ